MGNRPTLIFCASGNRRYAQIAIDAGFEYGAQLPGTVYHPIYFADQNWKKPNRSVYMAALAEHRPYIASVLDWEHDEQLPEVIAWAEEAARFVEIVMIIPKVHGGVSRLPREIGGRPVRLGYSVPTKFGGTQVHVAEFAGWPVHLLGGSPHAQMRLSYYLDVVSVDGNMHLKMAWSCCRFWRAKKGEKGHWINMYEVGDGGWGMDANHEAFRRSCLNIIAAWNDLYHRS